MLTHRLPKDYTSFLDDRVLTVTRPEVDFSPVLSADDKITCIDQDISTEDYILLIRSSEQKIIRYNIQSKKEWKIDFPRYVINELKFLSSNLLIADARAWDSKECFHSRVIFFNGSLDLLQDFGGRKFEVVTSGEAKRIVYDNPDKKQLSLMLIKEGKDFSFEMDKAILPYSKLMKSNSREICINEMVRTSENTFAVLYEELIGKQIDNCYHSRFNSIYHVRICAIEDNNIIPKECLRIKSEGYALGHKMSLVTPSDLIVQIKQTFYINWLYHFSFDSLSEKWNEITCKSFSFENFWWSILSFPYVFRDESIYNILNDGKIPVRNNEFCGLRENNLFLFKRPGVYTQLEIGMTKEKLIHILQKTPEIINAIPSVLLLLIVDYAWEVFPMTMPTRSMDDKKSISSHSLRQRS